MVVLLLLLLLLLVVVFVRSVCGDSTVAFLFMAVQSAVFPGIEIRLRATVYTNTQTERTVGVPLV